MIHETEISNIIVETYTSKLLQAIESDVLIAGAGPSGLLCAIRLAKNGCKVTIIEKHLTPGGGIWGGGMGMNRIVVQKEAIPLLADLNLMVRKHKNGLYSLNSIELACSLTKRAIQAGVKLFNLLYVEDVCIHNKKVCGLVVNRTGLSERLPIDPITFQAKEVVDATGHDAVAVNKLRIRSLLPSNNIYSFCEGAMEVTGAEAYVVNNTGEVYQGLWLCGMCVCHVFGGPRMGPIFGGMLLSGQRAADLILERIMQDRSFL